MTRWQYVHEYIKACEVFTKTVMGGEVVEVEIADTPPYPQASIQSYLNRMGADGWELVMMEPHWFWEERYTGVDTAVTSPKVIAGYWCTFKRTQV